MGSSERQNKHALLQWIAILFLLILSNVLYTYSNYVRTEEHAEHEHIATKSKSLLSAQVRASMTSEPTEGSTASQEVRMRDKEAQRMRDQEMQRNVYQWISQGEDFEGNDVGEFMSSNKTECAAQCSATPACVGFTLSLKLNRCWLKAKMDVGVPRVDRINYVISQRSNFIQSVSEIFQKVAQRQTPNPPARSQEQISQGASILERKFPDTFLRTSESQNNATRLCTQDDYLARATCLVASIPNTSTNGGSNKFLFLIMGNKAFLPFIHNWLCNTAHMHGVHERTLLLFTDDGYETISTSQFKVSAQQVDKTLAKEYQGDQDYDTYGYWRLVQLRVQIIITLINAGIPFLICEPDALWVQNPLLDPALSGPEDLVGFDDNSGVPGFGFLRVWANEKVREMFKEMEQIYSAQMPKVPPPIHQRFNVVGEQDIIKRLIDQRASKSYKDLSFKMLPQTKYLSGKWYDGGRGGDGAATRKQTKEAGLPYVINNNWIVGNGPKVTRAKRWGHWFVQDDGAGTCKDAPLLKRQVDKMLATMETLQATNGPPTKDECPKCRRRILHLAYYHIIHEKLDSEGALPMAVDSQNSDFGAGVASLDDELSDAR